MAFVSLARSIISALCAVGLIVGLPARLSKAADAFELSKSYDQMLSDWGLRFSGAYIGEVLANVSGGSRRGTIYAGRLDLGVDIDLDRLTGWSGAKFHANIFQIHGDGLSRSYVGNLLLISGIEALPATRLYEMWVEQSLLGGALAIRVGQQPSDVEFIDSQYDDIFANSALGWPGITGVILPSGGPSPPLAVPGIRIKLQLSERITSYLAIFDGDAAPPGPGDPQLKNPHGLLFRVNDPPWVIGQTKFGFEIGSAKLPGSLTGGAWYHFGMFDSQRYDSVGASLTTSGMGNAPARLRGNHGLFAVYEQKLMHSTINPQMGLGFFVRASASPSDRNLIDLYLDGGIQVTGFSLSRPNDKVGLGLIYARISSGARDYDRDARLLAGAIAPIRDYEAVAEFSYLAEVKRGLVVQPLLQYVRHPGGGTADRTDAIPTRRIKDAVVVGLRSTLSF